MSQSLPYRGSLVTVTVLAGGQAIKSAYPLLGLKVMQEVNRIPMARLVFLDGDPASETFAISDSADFLPGKQIEIQAGYNAAETSIFKGIILRHEIKARHHKPSMLILECRDEAVKTTVGRKSRYFLDSKDSDAIEKILGEHGLSKDITATAVQHKNLVQYNASDWDFMVMRAEANGQVVIARAGQVATRVPDGAGSAVYKITYGKDVLDMELSLDAKSQLPALNSRAWDPATQALVTAAGSAAPAGSFGNVSASTLAQVLNPSDYTYLHAGPLPQEELQAWATAGLVKSSLAKIRGRIQIEGTASLQAGDLVELAGAGDRFNGTGYVSGISHDIAEGRWVTDIQLGLAPEWFAQNEDIMDKPAAGLVPGIQGLQIGQVKQLAQDPDGEFRILVSMPLYDASNEGVWARLAKFYASGGVGAFFLPEVSDEVVVGFINEDPRYAVILGMLHSKANASPLEHDEKNLQKLFMTKNKLQLAFDEEKKSIALKTPGGNSILLDEDGKSITITDQNKNTITLAAGGITLDSKADITIKATGDINLTATGNLKLSANADVSLAGLNIAGSAKMQFKAQGTASAELSSSGQTTVKGAIVMIN